MFHLQPSVSREIRVRPAPTFLHVANYSAQLHLLHSNLAQVLLHTRQEKPYITGWIVLRSVEYGLFR